MPPSFSLRVKRAEQVALGIKLFELVSADSAPLPPVEAGAHIELKLTDTLSRSYSLLNEPGDSRRYVVAVHLSPDSAGGSRYMHEHITEGQVIEAVGPRNHFLLKEDATHSCLIAGGIGITPLLSMARRLTLLGRPWELHYCARTREHAAFVRELEELGQISGSKVNFYFDQEEGGLALNIPALVGSHSAQVHFYCCGPGGMLKAFEQATEHCHERRHVEYFGARQEAALAGGFEIELARSGKRLNVPVGSSILDVVQQAGIAVASSCREGICGSCETRILQGAADHRDALLSDQEKQDQKSMMICCSGSLGPLLVLDL